MGQLGAVCTCAPVFFFSCSARSGLRVRAGAWAVGWDEGLAAPWQALRLGGYLSLQLAATRRTLVAARW